MPPICYFCVDDATRTWKIGADCGVKSDDFKLSSSCVDDKIVLPGSNNALQKPFFLNIRHNLRISNDKAKLIAFLVYKPIRGNIALNNCVVDT